MKIAVLTGATKGIGKAIAEELIKDDIYVIGTATTESGAQAISANLQDKGEGRVLNLLDKNSIVAFAEGVLADFPEISILINNAGITKDNLILRMNTEDWHDVIDVNLSAPALLTKLLLKRMIKNRPGRIINLTSVVASTGNPGQANYVSAKAGIIGFTKALALEIASRDITVNAIAPGFIETDMTGKLTEAQKETILNKIPMRKLGNSQDIAAAVKFLLSDDARYITGTTIHVNGGLYMN